MLKDSSLYELGTFPNPVPVTATSPKSNIKHSSKVLEDVKELYSWLVELLDVTETSVDELLGDWLEVLSASVELELELTLESELEPELVVLLKNVDELDIVLESDVDELVSETSVELEVELGELELEDVVKPKLDELELDGELDSLEDSEVELEVVPRSVLLLDKVVEELSLVLTSVLELEVVKSSVEEDDKLDENDSHSVSSAVLRSSFVFGISVTRTLSPNWISVLGRK